MKKIWLILLMCFFPLQATLAAVEAYRGYQPDHSSGVDSALHVHGHHFQEHDQPESAHTAFTAHDAAFADSEPACEEGDHHHCHAHCVTLLPLVSQPDFPSTDQAQSTEYQLDHESCFPRRIERPHWI